MANIALNNLVVARPQIIEDLSVFGPEIFPARSDLTNANNFCRRCSLIDWLPAQTYLELADEYSFYPRVSIYQDHPSIAELKEAAYIGCHLCTLVLTCLLTMRYRFSIGVDPIPSGLSSITDSCKVKVEVEAMAKRPPVYLNVGLDKSANDLSDWIDLGIPILSAFDNERSSHISFAMPAEDIARYWLEDCRSSHGGQYNAILPSLPKRVIDIRSKPHPFLVETLNTAGEYAALSYSFGGYPVLTTTQETLQARKVAIPLVSLPQTVQDAIWWTRKLGVQYLWVDSLCILQDILTDWELELGSMAAIYRDATITIAATASQNAGSGCLPVRNKLSLAPCSPVPSVLINPDYDRNRWIFQKGALEDRAWTFQEIQLSRRVLRCGGEELAWQCRRGKRREGDPTVCKAHDTDRALGTFFGTRVLDDMKRIRESGYNFWYQIVAQFAERKLSFSGDKLPAFSGMAGHFDGIFNASSNRSEQEYLAGLWRGDLLHGLVWRALDPGPRIPYRAPSWSWAALDTKVVYNPHALQENNFCAEVLHAEVTVPGLNAFGKVRSGKLTLLAPVAPMPSQVYADDSDIGHWRWQWPLVTCEYEGLPPLGCLVLRLQRRCGLLLAPVGRVGVYRRVGMVVLPTEVQDAGGVKVGIMDGLGWEERVVTLI